MPRSDFIPFLFLFTSTFLISCSDLLDGTSINSALRDELNDRGKTKLDPGNPYVAPNAFLAEEAKSSENLKGFLSMKGNPTAISYHEDFFSSPELELFYDDKGEVFKLKQSGKSWIISSPIKSETTEKKDENKGSSLFKEEPPIVTYMDPKLEEARKRASGPSLKPESTTPADNQPLEKKAETPKNDKLDPEEKEFVDIFHIIEFEGQTLTFIAYWYTGSETNADRIAGINGINKSAPLRLSQSIRIPSYLCLKKDKPTEMDFKNFSAN